MSIDTELKFPADGNTTVLFIPGADSISDPDAPTTEELGDPDAVDLSCDIQSGGLDTGISTGVIDSASLCSAFVSQAAGRTTVSPTLTMWRYKQPMDTAYQLFRTPQVGWLVIRTGIPTEDAWEDGQELDLVALVETTPPAPAYPGGDTLNTFQIQPLLVSGGSLSTSAVVGGGS